MFRGARKQLPAQGREGRQVRRVASSNPAFSYYTSRTPDVNRVRTPLGNTPQHETEEGGKSRSSRSLISRLPVWLLGVVVVVCLGKVLVLTTDPKVVVLGQTAVTGTYVESTAAYGVAAHQLLARDAANHTKLTADLDGTARALQQEFPELQHVSLEAPLVGSRPILYIQVTQPSLILQSPQGNYALNDSGITLARLSKLPPNVPLVVDQSGSSLRVSGQALPSSTVSFVQTVAYQLAAAKLDVSAFVLPVGKPYELDIRLEGKAYVVRCNLEADARTQSGALIATVQQLGQRTPAQYLDLRTPGRVYYK